MGCREFVIALVCSAPVALAPAIAAAEEVCGTVEEFNAAMAAAGTASTDVRLTFDVVGVNPNDFFNTKGSLAQMRNTTCAAGSDATIKVYGTSEPLNESHLPGTLKLEFGNQCCPDADCGELWADPNSSVPIFADGTETCNVSMWIDPMSVGYSLVCNNGTFDAVGDNSDANAVDAIALLEYFLADGGVTWELPNATATNDEVCWEQQPSDMMTVTVPVAEDVTTGAEWADTVFPDVGDLAVEVAFSDVYLKFAVPEIEGKITEVRLFMHTRPDASSDGDGGELHAVASSDWSEATMTWNSRPMYDAASLGRIGPAAADVLVSMDLGTAIDSPGTYSFAIVSPQSDSNGTHFFSKEGDGTQAAYLIVSYQVVDGDGDGTPDGPDCNDADPEIGPGATEVCNGVDDNCDEQIDEGCGDESGDSSGGGEAGGSDDAEGSGDGNGTGLGPGLPADGNRGEELGCACTSSPRPHAGAWGLLLLALAFVRRRSPA